VGPSQYASAPTSSDLNSHQSFQLGGHNTVIVYWTLTSLWNTSCAAPKFPHPG